MSCLARTHSLAQLDTRKMVLIAASDVLWQAAATFFSLIN